MFRLIGLLSRIALRMMLFYLVVIGLIATGGFAGVGPLADDLAGQDVPVVGISADTVAEAVSGTPVAGLSDAVSDSAADIESRVADRNPTAENATADPNAADERNTSAEERRVERLIHEEINRRRAAEGLDPLTRDADLRQIARNHSADMVADGYVGHESPDGVTPRDRLTSVGCRAGGENVAQSWIDEPVNVDGDTIVADTERELATHLVNRWMASPGHRENVLRESFAESGIGVEITDDNRVYATQNFCAASPFGVVGSTLRYNQIHHARRR